MNPNEQIKNYGKTPVEGKIPESGGDIRLLADLISRYDVIPTSVQIEGYKNSAEGEASEGKSFKQLLADLLSYFKEGLGVGRTHTTEIRNVIDIMKKCEEIGDVGELEALHEKIFGPEKKSKKGDIADIMA